jgi:hypothetical protein
MDFFAAQINLFSFTQSRIAISFVLAASLAQVCFFLLPFLIFFLILCRRRFGRKIKPPNLISVVVVNSTLSHLLSHRLPFAFHSLFFSHPLTHSLIHAQRARSCNRKCRLLTSSTAEIKQIQIKLNVPFFSLLLDFRQFAVVCVGGS